MDLYYSTNPKVKTTLSKRQWWSGLSDQQKEFMKLHYKCRSIVGNLYAQKLTEINEKVAVLDEASKKKYGKRLKVHASHKENVRTVLIEVMASTKIKVTDPEYIPVILNLYIRITVEGDWKYKSHYKVPEWLKSLTDGSVQDTSKE